MRFYETFRREIGRTPSYYLDEYKASVCVKTVLWMLSDPNSGWTVESLRDHLDPEKRYILPQLPKPSEKDIAELAYTLWQKAGSPISDGIEFWEKAEKQLMRYGELPNTN